jgi:peptidoglycan/xylan/chitin deacetylase (PgdA/CDA1 family)
MRAETAKQLFKNGLYRALGETVAGLDGANGREERTLRVLMYHKVNPLPDNPVTVSPARFAEQMELLEELGYQVVDLDAVIGFYVHGRPLPERAVLITFDDGYRDNLEHALPVLERHGYPAVLFVPIAFVDDPLPLPHESHLLARGVSNRTLDWSELAELDSRGVRVESHGISHRALAELEVDDAAREIVLSKLRLEQRLGRPVRAFAYVKGSEAHFKPVHPSLLQQAGYEIAFSAITGANGPSSDRFRLRRYNVEPYSRRSFELVLAGACDLIAVKDTVAGTHARRGFNALLGTTTR